MGLFARLLRDNPSAPALGRPHRLVEGGFSAVAGESHYQQALAKTSRIARLELDEGGEERFCFEATLVREPSNPYDERAVAVYSPKGLVGYAPRDSGWCELLDLAAEHGYDGATCRANLSGGGNKSWGVVLHAHPEREDRALRQLEDS